MHKTLKIKTGTLNCTGSEMAKARITLAFQEGKPVAIAIQSAALKKSTFEHKAACDSGAIKGP